MKVLLYTPSARIGGVEVWSFTFFFQLLKQKVDTTLFSGEAGQINYATYVDSPVSTTKYLNQRNKCVLMYEL